MPTKSKKNKGSVKEVKVRELEFKEDLQEYAKVISLLGNRRITVKLPDMTDTMVIIGGKLKKKRVFIGIDDIILVSRRDFQEGKMDAIHKYTPDEVKKLIQYTEIPEWFAKTSAMISDEGVGNGQSNDLGFDFVGDDDEIDINDI
jgi:translation initiation factor 1A